MYLNPPADNLQELTERINAHETFRIYKRKVNERTMDRSFKRFGRSKVLLENGTMVVAYIFNGRVTHATLLVNIPKEIDGNARTIEIPPHRTATQPTGFLRNPDDDNTFAKLLKYMDDAEKNFKKPSN